MSTTTEIRASLRGADGGSKGDITLPGLFGEKPREHLVYEVVHMQQATRRAGTHATKTRAFVSGGGAKPWRQKGTGRARAGSFASPLWRGGGVTFGPKPRDFTKKINIRTRELALRKALSERLKAGDVVVVDDFKLGSPKTREFAGVLAALQLTGTALIVAHEANKNLTLASRNLPNVFLATSETLNTYDVLRPDKVVFTRSAFEKVESRLAKPQK